jgi:predicted ATPase
MTVQKLQLRNFRGFGKAAIELNALTVLLGPNSAGKSSFGHALSAMSYAQWLRSGSNQATLTPEHVKAAEEWPIDLGLRSDLQTHRAEGRVYVDLLTRDGWTAFGFGGLEPHIPDLRLTYVKYPQRMEQSGTAPASLETLPQPSPQTQSASGPVVRVDLDPDRNALELMRINEVDWTTREQRKTSVGLNGFLLETVRHESGTELLVSGRAREDIQQLLSNLTYLRATRKRPARGYEQGTGKPQSIGYAGEWTPSILHTRALDPVSFAKPPAIPNTVEEAAKQLNAPWEVRNDALAPGTCYWLEHLGLAARVETLDSTQQPGRIETRFTVIPDAASHDVTEVGFGLSQVLPILVGGLIQRESGLFIVDLPEAHLHQRPQAELADFFCSLALSGRSAIVETHSEMFFHRLRLRAAMNNDLAAKITVYFLDPPTSEGLCLEPRKVGLGFEDELRWPAKFLQEAWEAEAQIKAVREARRLVAR